MDHALYSHDFDIFQEAAEEVARASGAAAALVVKSDASFRPQRPRKAGGNPRQRDRPAPVRARRPAHSARALCARLFAEARARIAIADAASASTGTIHP